MTTLETEENPDSIVLKQLLEESKKEFEEQEKQKLQEIQNQSLHEANITPKKFPIQQVVELGFPIELATAAYLNVGDDVEKMVEYIYKQLD